MFNLSHFVYFWSSTPIIQLSNTVYKGWPNAIWNLLLTVLYNSRFDNQLLGIVAKMDSIRNMYTGHRSLYNRFICINIACMRDNRYTRHFGQYTRASCNVFESGCYTCIRTMLSYFKNYQFLDVQVPSCHIKLTYLNNFIFIWEHTLWPNVWKYKINQVCCSTANIIL